jgi:hypothetical protein
MLENTAGSLVEHPIEQPSTARVRVAVAPRHVTDQGRENGLGVTSMRLASFNKLDRWRDELGAA